jgi:hypothetical protein
MDEPLVAEPWMVGYCCSVCDDDIEPGEVVRVVNIDWSDRAERAVATLAHDGCVEAE